MRSLLVSLSGRRVTDKNDKNLKISNYRIPSAITSRSANKRTPKNQNWRPALIPTMRSQCALYKQVSIASSWLGYTTRPHTHKTRFVRQATMKKMINSIQAFDF